MALATYVDLIAAIQAYEEDDSIIVTSRADDWVALAEQRIFVGSGSPGMPLYSPALRVRAIEATTIVPLQGGQDGGTSGGLPNAQTVTLAAVPTMARGLAITFLAGLSNSSAMTLGPNGLGPYEVVKGVSRDPLEEGDIVAGASYSVYFDGTKLVLMPSAGAAPLPPRFLGMKELHFQGNPVRSPAFLAPSQFSSRNDVNTAGMPGVYTIEGDSIRLGPLPGSALFLSCTYWRRPQPLATAINELFRQAPAIWLYGALLEAALYLGEDENITKWHGNFLGACQGALNADQRDRYGAAPLMMAVSGPTP